MEILSPAGNCNHIDLAIKKETNAVYGGLKKWNARNKAVNFSIHEYNSAINKLHKEKIKFYLTLNTLVFDNEIKEIINFLKSDETVLPDAFIVADIGLIVRLKKEFPNIPIHLSTQFGIHNIADIKFAESIGATRGILARELTFQEINNIKNSTNLEIENFVWGSQCISYSGLCFFGSLINCGNSNRGKCIITCRDIYEIKNEKGHFLYIPDLDCTNLTSDLEKSGIECIKLEGRRRKEEELGQVLDKIKNKIIDNKQNGYIYGEKVNINKLYEKVNTRIKPLFKYGQLKSVDKYDVFVDYDKNGMPVKFSENVKKDNSFYVFSEYKSDFKFDKHNISLDIEIKNGVIDKILYVNSMGEGKTFYSENIRLIEFDLDMLVNKIGALNEKINLYKVKYIKDKNKTVEVCENLIEELIRYIKSDNNDLGIKYKKNKDFIINKLYVEIDNVDYIRELINDATIKIVYNISSVENLKSIKQIIDEFEDKIIYKIPIFNYKSEDLKKYYKLLENKEVMFTKLSQLQETENINFKYKYIDYTIYVWNSNSLEFLKKYKIDEFTASPELSYETNMKIFKDLNIQYIVAGKLPLVYTRQCFSHLYNCEKCNCNIRKNKLLHNVDKNIDFKIICNSDHRIIVANNPMLNDYTKVDSYKNVAFRYITYDHTIDEIKESIRLLKQNNYYEKMKRSEIWKNSFEGNVLESRC